jgi:hypothetical protein
MGQVNDVRGAVEDDLTFDPDVDASDITVANVNGEVTLGGTVTSYPQYVEAAAVAGRVPGVRAEGIIGSRRHPGTGCLIVYVAATPVSDKDGVADGIELVEVRWAGLAEAAELMGDMSEAVRRHLIRSLDG